MKHSADTTTSYMLTSLDRKVLDIIQSAFPLEPRPYAVIARHVGSTEEEVFACVQNLKKTGIIRRLGANFQSHKLGFRSTLCAAKVPEETLEFFINAVNARKGVTHNYLRKHAYNVWFTLIAPSWEHACATLDDITKETGIPILNLPAKKLYKIRVDFSMQEDEQTNTKPAEVG